MVLASSGTCDLTTFVISTNTALVSARLLFEVDIKPVSSVDEEEKSMSVLAKSDTLNGGEAGYKSANFLYERKKPALPVTPKWYTCGASLSLLLLSLLLFSLLLLGVSSCPRTRRRNTSTAKNTASQTRRGMLKGNISYKGARFRHLSEARLCISHQRASAVKKLEEALLVDASQHCLR